MAPHSSTLAWKIPWMDEPDGLQSMGSQSWTWLSDFTFTFHFHALEKEMATHSSVLAWRIPGTAEPGGLPSMGWHRAGQNWSDLAAAAAASFLMALVIVCSSHAQKGAAHFHHQILHWIFSLLSIENFSFSQNKILLDKLPQITEQKAKVGNL